VPARALIAVMTAGGFMVLYGTPHKQLLHPLQFGLLLLIAQAQLSPAQALIIACASNVVQCLPRAGDKLKPVQVLINISTVAIAWS
jgi:hypothetical protein